ncbi:outer dynein arm-docking complex subunit 3-like [Saccostrea cucullata]|uniref:outer dynein arm-docking complex subunit 3-like n=1 Tax=Saccostrea cuccullata TaxID=36930 RepID=UPI002ED508B0
MQQDSQKTVDTTQTALDQIEELRGKIHLKERDAKACYESSETRKIQYEKLIAKLRDENKNKRVQLAKSINGDEEVIRAVFNNRREELLSMQRCTVDEAIKTMDQKVCEANKRLNNLRYQRTDREERVQEMEARLKRMKRTDAQDYDFERKREIRRLQNEMDKARIKLEAARNITRRYQEIMRYMEEECRLYPARLDNLETSVVQSRQELTVLRQMNEKAVNSKEEARTELHSMERDMYQAKRARDAQLNETKKEVERRREPVVERAEKRAKVNIIMDNTDSKAAKLQMEKFERQEHLLTLSEGFEKIKSAINVSDIEDIVFRVTNQESTHERLVKQEKEKKQAKVKLLEERDKLTRVFEEMKFTSQRQLAKGRKMVDEMQEFVAKEEKNCAEAVQGMEANEKLLIDLQFGIATLYDKLKEVKLKPPYHNFSKGDPVDDLANCSRKLELLAQEQAIKEEVPKLSKASDQFKLHAYLESQLSPENIRIRIETDDGSDDDEFRFDHDQDNEGLLSREDIKRLGKELLNSKLKPKRKKGRKQRN